jgi:hypothetical protein
LVDGRGPLKIQLSKQMMQQMQAKWALITLYLMNIDFDANFTDDDMRNMPAKLNAL